MLNEDEYNQLLPYRAGILTKRMDIASKYLLLADKIRQRMGMGRICFSCDGDKIAAMNDIHNLFKEYERLKK